MRVIWQIMGRAGGKEVSILFKAGRMRFTSNLKSITFIYKMVLDMIEFQFNIQDDLFQVTSEIFIRIFAYNIFQD